MSFAFLDQTKRPIVIIGPFFTDSPPSALSTQLPALPRIPRGRSVSDHNWRLQRWKDKTADHFRITGSIQTEVAIEELAVSNQVSLGERRAVRQ